VRRAAAARLAPLAPAAAAVERAVNNGVLLLDLVIFPDVDFSVWRGATALVSVSVLLYGLIWEGQ
jgi:hypothetical protein